ncbi:hypothetical protein AB0D08_31090 [Kitasatospora sp. NPDC048540]|uniref:hypothetical protein n=1 Tax=unclassified Kitasatospora TaxID=2633591 RepID=UPI00068F2DE7|nr:hypothetical protein [Kitasatospora sp. MBT63]
MTALAVPAAPSSTCLERDWRFAELVIAAHLDPALRYRYDAEPAPVLAEFGIHLPLDTPAPALGNPGGAPLTIENLNDVTILPDLTFCTRQ